ncbi:hypothetical protein MHU86_13711 [Fragilaria crotonensis]|nr:hypothetical protein MHU86_13711 [Fragilaria crotonensis]
MNPKHTVRKLVTKRTNQQVMTTFPTLGPFKSTKNRGAWSTPPMERNSAVASSAKHSFDPVCYATAICQLGGINSLDRRHLLFLGLLDDLIKQIQLRGMDWMDAGLFGDILHALAKMQLRDDHHAKEMINLIERQTQENPEWILRTEIRKISQTLFGLVEA